MEKWKINNYKTQIQRKLTKSFYVCQNTRTQNELSYRMRIVLVVAIFKHQKVQTEAVVE